jgi:hypothetical protein
VLLFSVRHEVSKFVLKRSLERDWHGSSHIYYAVSHEQKLLIAHVFD